MRALHRGYLRKLAILLASLGLGACAHLSPDKPSPVPLAHNVDLERYAGDWFLIAHIPTSRDRGAHNAQEHYQLVDPAHIGISYRNRLGGFDGRVKQMTPTAEVIAGSGNALWGVRFAWYWPFLHEYRIAHVEPDYSTAIVARSDLDYLWLFSRQPAMDDAQLERYTGLIRSWGYDTSQLERVPQQWPNPADGSMPAAGPAR